MAGRAPDALQLNPLSLLLPLSILLRMALANRNRTSEMLTVETMYERRTLRLSLLSSRIA